MTIRNLTAAAVALTALPPAATPALAVGDVPPQVLDATRHQVLTEVRATGGVMRPVTSDRYVGVIVVDGRPRGTVELLVEGGTVKTGAIMPTDTLAQDLVDHPEGLLVKDASSYEPVIVDGSTTTIVGGSPRRGEHVATRDYAATVADERAQEARQAQAARDSGVTEPVAAAAAKPSETLPSRPWWQTSTPTTTALSVGALLLGAVTFLTTFRRRHLLGPHA